MNERRNKCSNDCKWHKEGRKMRTRLTTMTIALHPSFMRVCQYHLIESSAFPSFHLSRKGHTRIERERGLKSEKKGPQYSKEYSSSITPFAKRRRMPLCSRCLVANLAVERPDRSEGKKKDYSLAMRRSICIQEYGNSPIRPYLSLSISTNLPRSPPLWK